LCFPKSPSEKNTDYRLLLLKKLLQSGQTKNDFHPLDITGNDKQIEKVNIADIGRSAEIEEIKKEMLTNNTVLVYGIGGIGKSYICRKLFWNYYDSFSDGIEYLAWIQYNGDLTQSATSSFYDPETNLDNIRKKYGNHPVVGDMFVKLALSDKPDDKMQVIKEYFSKLDSKLLVFIDNADTMTKEEKKWLNTCKCRMIITSRQKIEGFYGVNINSPSPEYCKEMYVREIWESNKETYSLEDEKYINKITELANYHTQTVMLIAKAQLCLGLSSEEMLEELNKTGFVLKGNDEIIDTEEYELTMAEHLTKIFNLLNVTDENQLRTIRLFSLLASNTPIKKRDIKKWFELSSLSSINELVKYGWLNSSGSEFVSIHPVIADVVKYNYKPDFKFALPLINAIQEELKAADDYVKKNAVIVHAVALADEFAEIQTGEFSEFLYTISSNFHDLACYDKSIRLLYLRQSINLKLFGEQHPIIAKTYDNLALAFCDKGDYQSSLNYNLKSLNLREKLLGTEHIDTASSYHNLSLLYEKQGKFSEAMEYCLKALKIKKEKLGSENQEVAASYCNLALIHDEIGNHDKAFEYQSKALAIRERILDTSDPDLANSYSNIGACYFIKGEYNQALNYFYKALSIQEKTIGLNHPYTAITYNNIAFVFQAKGNYEEAIDYYNKSLNIRINVLGEEHPYTAVVYNNIAGTYLDRDDNINAMKYYTMSFNIIKSKLGDEHPKTASSYGNIAKVYINLKQYDKALEYLIKSYNIRKKVFGEDNIKTQKMLKQIEEIKRILHEFE